MWKSMGFMNGIWDILRTTWHYWKGTNRCAQLQVVSDCWHLEITEINVTAAHGGVDRKDVWRQYEMG